MKKFLSILLALAVGFTFTFGSAMSAFAVTQTEVTTSITDVNDYTYAQAKALIDAQAAALGDLTSNIEKTALQSALSG